MIPTQLRRIALSAVIALGGGMTASAHTPSNPEAVKDLGKLSSMANLVVQTKVTGVAYRTTGGGMSTSASPGIPQTLVTFSITSVLQGKATSKSITLQFVGGPDGQGGYLAAEGVPTFQVGDQDILYVVNNGQQPGCALVMCEFGRFRVVNDLVYGAHGEPVTAINNGKLTLGLGSGPDQLHVVRFPTPSFSSMMRNPGFAAAVRASGDSIDTARARYAAGAPASIEVRERPSAGINGAIGTEATAAQVSVGEFVSSVSQAAAAGSREFSVAVESASLNAPLAAPQAAGAAPPFGSAAGTSLSPGPTIRKN